MFRWLIVQKSRKKAILSWGILSDSSLFSRFNPYGRSMKIIGIDPGYERCGYAILEDECLIDCGVIKTTPKAFELRLEEIGDDFSHLLTAHKPRVLSIEDLFFVQNVTTGMKVAEVRGLLIYLAQKSGCRIVQPKPVELKSSFTGNGKATKEEMLKMAQIRLGMGKTKVLDDTVDAIAAAFWGKNQLIL